MGLMTTITHWRSGRKAGRELTSLDTDELGALARDVGLSPDQLTRLTARGSREELSRLLDAVGLAAERIGRTHPDVMRDMSIVCSDCVSARRCRRDLDRGWAPVVQRYCPNTETIKVLQAERCHVVS
jgi:uncharacterized protein YjiS (DUF1127 family)